MRELTLLQSPQWPNVQDLEENKSDLEENDWNEVSLRRLEFGGFLAPLDSGEE